jgi:hypothetical protein
MADYTITKDGLGRVSPDGALEVSFEDLEPLITPDRLRSEHLLGLPLVAGIKNPVTGKPHVVTNDEIKVIIKNAVGLGELESKIEIFPKQYTEKQAFDRPEYQSWGYIQLRHRPVSSIQSMDVTTSDGTIIYRTPLEWVDVGYLHQGQLNILPLLMSIKSGQPVYLASGSGVSPMISLFTQNNWVPSFWEIKYTTGFKEGLIPSVINQYLGTIAAMEVLAMLAATHARTTSTSLGMDGVSQSISGPGAELYNNRLEQLASKRKWLMTRLKALYGELIIASNV